MEINRTAPTEAELEARHAEARKATAEGEFIILSEGKKKLKSDSEGLKVIIETDREVIEMNKQEIVKLKSTILDLGTSYTKEKENLNQLIIDKETAEQEFIDVKNSCEKQVQDTKAEITHKLQVLSDTKKEKDKEIEEVENKKKLILEKIETENINLRALTQQLEKESSNISSLLVTKENLQNETISLTKNNEKLKNDSIDLETEKAKKNLELENVNENIKTKIAIEKQLDSDIEKKTEEYKSIEGKAFSILQASDNLNKKEAFIRSQYERAGIEWQPD